MSHERFSIMLDELKRALGKAESIPSALQSLSRVLRSTVGGDEVNLFFEEGQELHGSTTPRAAPLFSSAELPFVPTLFASRVKSSSVPTQLRDTLIERRAVSCAIVPLGAICTRGWIEIFSYDRAREWSNEDQLVLRSLSEISSLYLERIAQRNADTDIDKYHRLIQYGNLLMVRTDEHLRVVEVQGDTDAMLGVPASDLLSSPNVWTRFVNARDLRRLAIKLRRMTIPTVITEEVRVRQLREGGEHWLLLKAVPLHDANGRFVGWEGFGLDLTEKKDALQKLEAERRRIGALYELSRSLPANTDPAVVVLRAVRELIAATGSDCGYGALLDSRSGKLEVVASEGLSETFLKQVTHRLNSLALLSECLDMRSGILVNDLLRAPNAAHDIVRPEGLRAAVIVPLMHEDEAAGILVIYSKMPGRYQQEDFELVSAAAAQVALVVRQAEMFAAERREASALAALYTLTREVSKYLTPREMGEHALPIIQRELPCRRMWLGVINEQGTHIVGQAGLGSGMRRHILNIQIELDLRHDFLDEAIKTRKPVIVPAGTAMECSGLNRIIKKLNVGTLVLVPLMALGQVVGVLVIEPKVASVQFAQRHLPLLTSMAAEVGTVILARRFEARMAETDKMRMAGLLASGVAHNFNNLLQAVVGQASLLEMQLPRESPLQNSIRTISSAAQKGAGLIRQLLSFSSPHESDRRPIDIHEMFVDSRELYRSMLGAGTSLEYRLGADRSEIVVNHTELQQLLSNVLINAREAIHAAGRPGMVKIATQRVRLRSGEVDPELAPGEYLRIDIDDNGIGMDEERAARCFEPFFTTKNADNSTGIGLGGFGLGLSSVYATMKRHHGLVSVSSKPGEGAEFSLYFPLRELNAEDVGREREGGVDVLLYGFESDVVAGARQGLGTTVARITLVKELRELLLQPRRDSGKDRQLVVMQAQSSDKEVSSAAERLAAAGHQVVLFVPSLPGEPASLPRFRGVEVILRAPTAYTVRSVIRERLQQRMSRGGIERQIEIERTGKSRARVVEGPSPARLTAPSEEE